MNEWGLVAFALAIGASVGAALGSMVTLRMARARHKEELRLATEDLRHRQASTASELRNAQARANQELERARLSFKRELASAGEAPRAAALEAEERLRAAYDEMDRLRRAASAPRPQKPEAPHGFATTEVMDDRDTQDPLDQGFAPTQVMTKAKSGSSAKSKPASAVAATKETAKTKSPARWTEASASGFPSTEVLE